MMLFLLILLMFSSVLPAIKIHSWSAFLTHEELVKAHKGEMMLAVHRREESRLTTKEILENSPESRLDVELEPHSKKIKGN
jgi:hypothetical protein